MASNTNSTTTAALDLITTGWHLRLDDSLALSSLTVLLYDHLLTFGDEIELIWKRKFLPITVLFLFNRYFVPMALTICVVALFLTNWTLKACNHFAKFEGSFTLVTLAVVEAMLIIRVHAVYHGNNIVVGFLVSLWIAQVSAMSIILSASGPLIIPHSSVTHGCILVGHLSVTRLGVLFFIPTLVLDSTVILLLVFNLIRRSRYNGRSSLFNLIVKDGILYFVVVSAFNLAWMFIYLVLPIDLKEMLAYTCTIMTSVLIGRLTLNLKQHESREYAYDVNMRRCQHINHN